MAPSILMLDLIPGDIISNMIAFTGLYEFALSREILRLARDEALLVDVGANMGYFSLLWTSAHPGARAAAIEASPRNIRLLEANIAANGLGERARTFPLAAGKDSGTLLFDAGPEGQTGWGGISSSESPAAIETPVSRLDDLFPEDTIDVLKIDVEGADAWVLQGAERLLRERRVRRIFFEQNTARMAQLGIDRAEALDCLSRHGYECRPFGKGKEEWEARRPGE